MTRMIAVLVAVLALALPAAALAQTEAYYSSYGEPEALTASAPEASADDAGPWRTLAIAAGGLVLVLGAAELITLGRLHRATAA
jgi:hypothetical protein